MSDANPTFGFFSFSGITHFYLFARFIRIMFVQTMYKQIGILTGGGDAPGLTAGCAPLFELHCAVRYEGDRHQIALRGFSETTRFAHPKRCEFSPRSTIPGAHPRVYQKVDGTGISRCRRGGVAISIPRIESLTYLVARALSHREQFHNAVPGRRRP